MTSSKQTEKQAIKTFLAEAKKLWPPAKGSLAEVRKPCIRPGCKACASGKKHRAFIFSFKKGGHRRCMYVPLEMVAPMRQAIRNGRVLEKRMSGIGPELITRFRQHQKPSTSMRRGKKRTK